MSRSWRTAYRGAVSGAERADVVVVGAGLLGLSTAYSLRGGRDVVVLERETVGHARAGSHGPSRIFRLGYADPLYVDLARRAFAGWRALEAESGAALLDLTGQLSFGPGAEAVFEALTAAGSAAEWLSADAVERRFPMFAGRGTAVFEPDSGVLAAREALTALRVAAECDLREHTRVRSIVDHEGGVRIKTDAGRIEANVAVVTAGPWTRALVGLRTPTVATLEHVAYVRPRSPGVVRPPVFIDHRPRAVYGLPTPGSDRYKIALHHAGAVVDPDATSLGADALAVEALEAATRHWLPEFEPVAETIDTCLYDNTPDDDFVLDRAANVVIGAGTSGHGFKFGVVLGALLAELVEGRAPTVQIERFRNVARSGP